MKHLIVPSIILFMTVSGWVVMRIGKTAHRSISQHVAQSPLTQIVFGIGAGIASFLAAIAVFGWMLPHYGANYVSYGLFSMLILGFLIAAFIPHIETSWRGRVHNNAAWGIVYVIPITMISVLFWPLSYLAWWISVFLLIVNGWLLFLSVTRKELRRVFLYYQIAYIVIFYFLLIVLTYL